MTEAHASELKKGEHKDHRPKKTNHAPIVSRRTALFALAGLIVGLLLGLWIGYLMSVGSIPAGRLAVLSSSSLAVPMFVCCVITAALFGLAGAMTGIFSESAGAGHEDRHRSKRDPSTLLGAGPATLLPIIGSVAIVLVMVHTLYRISSRALGAAPPSEQTNRVTWNQKNVVRVGGITEEETYRQALQIAYPTVAEEVSVPDDWRAALAATPLIARPINAAISIRSDGMSLTGQPEDIAASVDARVIAARGTVDPNVIVVASHADAGLALPAAAYAARTGTPILFVERNAVPEATQEALARRGGRARIWVLAPADVVPESLLSQLRQHGAVRRIGDGNVFANAVEFARFRDFAAQFGWGRDARGPTRYSSSSVIVVNPEAWQDAIAAAHLARGGKSGPLLFVEKDRVPGVVDNYLWRQRPIFKNTPAEGPFNHAWIVGSFDRISYKTQAWIDYSQEIEQYMTLGDSGVSGFEALTIAWLSISLAVAIFIFVHGMQRIPEMMPTMRLAWTIFALLLGLLALPLYLHSYNGWPTKRHDGMTMWHRSFFGQTVSATVMMFAFDMMLMVLAVFAIATLGFPIVRGSGPLYWLGTSMFLMMVLMYLVALVVMMLLFHAPMTMHERKLSYGKALAVGFPLMFATMTVESLGMMPTMWWAQMFFLPAMQMPTEDDLSMWGTLILAAIAGLLIVLPFNAWLVKQGKKMGMM